MKIMIVDDLADMRLVLTMTLQRHGWEVVEAEDGEQAIQTAILENPDVILMDYNMPILNGIDACRRLKQHPEVRQVPIMIYTGAYASDVRDAAVAAGADSFLTKPILPKELRAEVEKIYSSWEAQANAPQ